MWKRKLTELYFSQSALAVYQQCQLKFRRRYLDGLYWPQNWYGSSAQQQAIEQGQLFHRLAQRYYARGEVLPARLLPEKVAGWFQRLRDFRPYNQLDLFRPEQELRVNTGGIKLVAKFDLLYINQSKQQVVIYDWKTNDRPLGGGNWSQKLQTIVYLYVLAQAGRPYFPGNKLSGEDLSLIYWNPRFPGQLITVRYSKEMLQQHRDFLKSQLTEIKALPYEEFRATDKQAVCRRCEYRPLCHGQGADYLELVDDDELEAELNWEEIDQLQY